MKQQQILIISEITGENPDMVNALRGEPDWQVSLASSAEEGITSFYAKPFDVIVIGKGVTTSDEQKLRAVLNRCSFEHVIIKQENNNPETLKKEIRSLLNTRRINGLQHIRVSDTSGVVSVENDIRLIPFGVEVK